MASEDREFWHVRIVREECIEAPKGWTARAVCEAMNTDAEWVPTGEQWRVLDGPQKMQRPDGVTRRIMPDGAVEDVEPMEAPAHTFRWQGETWATNGYAIWREDVAPMMPRGSWAVASDDQVIASIVPLFGDDLATIADARVTFPSAVCAELVCDGYSALLNIDLMIECDRWLCGGPLAPARGYRGADLVCVVMPMRDTRKEGGP